MTGDSATDLKVQELLGFLEDQDDDTLRYGIMEQIISRFRQENRNEQLKCFLSDQLFSHPEDSYNAYYLLVLGTLFEEENAPGHRGHLL